MRHPQASVALGSAAITNWGIARAYASRMRKSIIGALPSAEVAMLCRVCPSFEPVALAYLGDRLPAWSPADVARAAAVEWSAACPHLVAVRRRVLEEQRTARRRAPAATSMHPPAPVAPSSMPPAPSGTPGTATHQSRVAALAQSYPAFSFVLIGSGVFRDTGDLDVAVAVPGTVSLEEAYHRFGTATGWRRRGVVGARITIFTGFTQDGVPVDAQVWRGASAEHDYEPAEVLTRHAIALTARITDQISPWTRECARQLHAWADAAGAKGHLLCRLPGIAITCLAIVLSARGATERLALEALRDWITQDFPRVDLDRVDITSGEGRMGCTSIPKVIVNEQNCASRLTLLTARHMADLLQAALALPSDRLYAAAEYDAWRRATMVLAARMAPRTAGAVAQSLLATVSSLDGHPLLTSLYVAETHDAIDVFCTLDATADAARYGFRSTDEVHRDGTMVIVRRGRLVLELPLSHRPSTASLGAHSSVADMLTLPGMPPGCAFPNAPTLGCDVCGRFDERLWRKDAKRLHPLAEGVGADVAQDTDESALVGRSDTVLPLEAREPLQLAP